MTTIATRVLLVDDDDDLRHAHLQTLRLAEVSARGFAGAEDALRHIDRAFAGVVVTDVRMPGMDGLAFASRIRDRPRPAGHPDDRARRHRHGGRGVEERRL